MSEDEVIHLLPPSPPPPLSMDKEQKYKSTLSSASTDMRISFWFCLILSIVCQLITTIILIVSKSMSLERKLFIGGIVEIIVASLQIMLCITRNEHRSLSIFVIICTFISALGLGMTIRIE